MMRRLPRWMLVLSALLGSFATGTAAADEIEIAVASNFSRTLRIVADTYQDRTGHIVTLSPGSTGKHYAQIVNGAPFDAFFAADRDRPEKLEAAGLALAGTRFTYAIGRLVLYSRWEELVDAEGAVLTTGGFHHLAIANPRLAPYGLAARQVLERMGLWEKLQDRIVRGENIGQTFQFIASGNADLGFVAWSQLVSTGEPITGSWWLVPSGLHTPIEQQAVLLEESEAARSFLGFVTTDEARALIQQHGYETP